MKWRNLQTLFGLGIAFFCICAQAKPVIYPAVSDIEKPQIKAKYAAEQSVVKKQLSLQQSQGAPQDSHTKPTLETFNVYSHNSSKSLNDQLSSSGSYVGDKPQQRTLTNDYPLTHAGSKSTKPRVKARYSGSGITSDAGVEKHKVYQYKQTNGVVVFSDQQPQDADYQILLYECFACRVDSIVDWHHIPLFTSPFATDVASAARQYQLDPALIRAVIHAESAFKPSAISKAGAKGLMQLMPGTASDMGVDNPLDAQQNIRGGSRYLAQLLAQFNGDLDLACAAYNAGPSTVTQYSGIPPYPETQAYVKRVKILFKRYQKALAS